MLTEHQHGTAAADNWQTPDTGKCGSIKINNAKNCQNNFCIHKIYINETAKLYFEN